MEDNDAPGGGASMNPRGTVGRIYKEDHNLLLHTKMKALGIVVLERHVFCLPHCKSMGANDPCGGPFLIPGA